TGEASISGPTHEVSRHRADSSQRSNEHAFHAALAIGGALQGAVIEADAGSLDRFRGSVGQFKGAEAKTNLAVLIDLGQLPDGLCADGNDDFAITLVVVFNNGDRGSLDRAADRGLKSGNKPATSGQQRRTPPRFDRCLPD